MTDRMISVEFVVDGYNFIEVWPLKRKVKISRMEEVASGAIAFILYTLLSLIGTVSLQQWLAIAIALTAASICASYMFLLRGGWATVDKGRKPGIHIILQGTTVVVPYYAIGFVILVLFAVVAFFL